MTLTRLMVVEDDTQIRGHLTEMVLGLDGVELLRSSSHLADARKAKLKDVDLCLLDIGLPDGSGIDLIADLKTANPAVKVLIFTVFGDQTSVISAFDAGADGFILKDSGPEEIRQAITSVLNGEAPISARAAAFLLRTYRRDQQNKPSHKTMPDLSPREFELLQFLARGFSYKEAARKMDISPSTVSEYAGTLYRKLAVNSRGEAVFEAMQYGLVDI